MSTDGERKIWVIEARPWNGDWKPDGIVFRNFPDADKEAKRQLSMLNNMGHKDYEIRVRLYEAKIEIWEIKS